MSDAAVTPSLRIQTSAEPKSVSFRGAHARIDAFLQDFQQRSTPLNGGDATVPAQLSKLRDALKEEREASEKKPKA